MAKALPCRHRPHTRRSGRVFAGRTLFRGDHSHTTAVNRLGYTSLIALFLWWYGPTTICPVPSRSMEYDASSPLKNEKITVYLTEQF